jgi:hypothetical protein
VIKVWGYNVAVVILRLRKEVDYQPHTLLNNLRFHSLGLK